MDSEAIDKQARQEIGDAWRKLQNKESLKNSLLFAYLEENDKSPKSDIEEPAAQQQTPAEPTDLENLQAEFRKLHTWDKGCSPDPNELAQAETNLILAYNESHPDAPIPVPDTTLLREFAMMSGLQNWNEDRKTADYADNEHGFVLKGSDSKGYDLALFGLTPAQVKAIGKSLGKGVDAAA